MLWRSQGPEAASHRPQTRLRGLPMACVKFLNAPVNNPANTGLLSFALLCPHELAQSLASTDSHPGAGNGGAVGHAVVELGGGGVRRGGGHRTHGPGGLLDRFCGRWVELAATRRLAIVPKRGPAGASGGPVAAIGGLGGGIGNSCGARGGPGRGYRGPGGSLATRGVAAQAARHPAVSQTSLRVNLPVHPFLHGVQGVG